MFAVKSCSWWKRAGTAAVFTQLSCSGTHLAAQGGRNMLTWALASLCKPVQP